MEKKNVSSPICPICFGEAWWMEESFTDDPQYRDAWCPDCRKIFEGKYEEYEEPEEEI